jgi:hypothetical protein
MFFFVRLPYTRIFARSARLLLILSAVLVGLFAPQAEAQVPLTLRENPDDPATALPTGTEVLSVQWDKSRAQSLSELGFGDRSRLRRRIEKRLENEPEKAYARVASEDGTTGRSDFEKNQIYYVLALTPQGRLYESQVGPSDNKEPGADLVVSGRARLGPVPEAHRQTLRQAFRKAAQVGLTAESLTAPLTLRSRDGLPEGTAVRVWTENGTEPRLIARRSGLDRQRAKKASLGRDGQVGIELPRTRYAGKVAYAVARAPDGTYYESQTASGAGYDRIEEGVLEMSRVVNPQAALQPVFPDTEGSSDSGANLLGGWVGWIVLFTLGLAVGLMVAWRYRKEAREFRTEVERQEAEIHKLKKERSKDRDGMRGTEQTTAQGERSVQEASSTSRTQAREGSGKDQSTPDDRESEEAIVEPSATAEKGTMSPGLVKAVGSAFVDWCETAAVMRGRYYMFERELQGEHSEASVTPVYLDPQTEGRFRTDLEGTTDEFWCVEIKGSAVLLPSPKRDGRFRALNPAFQVEGYNERPVSAASCEGLRSCRPARLESEEEGEYTVSKPGILRMVHSEAPDSVS